MEHSEHFDCTPRDAHDDLLVSAEYEAGHQARREGSEDYRTATPSWRSGWRDADHDLRCGLLSNCCHLLDQTEPHWSALGSGWDARSCELPFDQQSSCDWKREWVLADIAIGMAANRGKA